MWCFSSTLHVDCSKAFSAAATNNISETQGSAEPQNWLSMAIFNTPRPRQNRRHFAEDIFKCIFYNEHVWISIKISLKFVPNGPIKNNPSLAGSDNGLALARPGWYLKSLKS